MTKVEYHTIIEQIRPRLLSLAKRYIQSPANAEDLVQNTVLRGDEKLSSFDPSRGKSRSVNAKVLCWLQSIMFRLNSDATRYKAMNREVVISQLPKPPAENTALFTQDVIDAEEVAINNMTLENMLKPLSVIERRIAKRLSEGDNDDEIKKTLHISTVTYEKYIKSIQEKLIEGGFYNASSSVG